MHYFAAQICPTNQASIPAFLSPSFVFGDPNFFNLNTYSAFKQKNNSAYKTAQDLNALRAHNERVKRLIENKSGILENARRLVEMANPMLKANSAAATPPNPVTIETLKQECDKLVATAQNITVRIDEIRRKERRQSTIATLNTVPLPPVRQFPLS